jgi:hypothetical protein
MRHPEAPFGSNATWLIARINGDDGPAGRLQV